MFNKATISALAALALLPLQQSVAESQDYYLSPMLNYIISDNDRQADDAFGGQLAIGRELSERWNLELNIELDTLDGENGTSGFKQKGLTAGALYFFNRDQAFSPYALASAGVMQNRYAGDRNSNSQFNLGIGALTQISDNGTSLRFELRHRWDHDDNSIASEDKFNDWVVSAGLSIPLGSSTPAAPAQKAAPQPAAPSDSDNDGVIDSQDSCPNSAAGSMVDAKGCALPKDGDKDGVTDANDRCPNTAPGVKVDAKGCALPQDSDQDGVADANDSCPNTPAGAQVDAKGCQLVDSDKDGIYDNADRCANTPAGAKVDSKGCELDSDGDTIVDRLDQCPNSAAGQKVDNKGCEIKDVISLKGVVFANNSDSLVGDSVAILDDAAEVLKRNSDLQIEVAGYTDNRGAQSYNVNLSQRRAEAVRKYLTEQGVAADRLSAKGYGPANPVADNQTSEGRALNRRVELRILN